MGYYINPLNQTKEDFLLEHGEPIEPHQAKNILIGGTHFPVCLVDNGLFTAAGIGFSEEEIEAFNYPNDNRPKTWWSVSRKDLKPYFDDSKGE